MVLIEDHTPHTSASYNVLSNVTGSGGCLIIQFGVVREIPDSFVLLKLLRQSAIILCRINVAESDWNDTTLWGDLLRGLNEQLRDKRAAGNISPGLASDLTLYPPGQPSEGEVEREGHVTTVLCCCSPKSFLRFPQWRTLFRALKLWNPCRWVGYNSPCYESPAMNLDPKSRHTTGWSWSKGLFTVNGLGQKARGAGGQWRAVRFMSGEALISVRLTSIIWALQSSVFTISLSAINCMSYKLFNTVLLLQHSQDIVNDGRSTSVLTHIFKAQKHLLHLTICFRFSHISQYNRNLSLVCDICGLISNK